MVSIFSQDINSPRGTRVQRRYTVHVSGSNENRGRPANRDRGSPKLTRRRYDSVLPWEVGDDPTAPQYSSIIVRYV